MKWRTLKSIKTSRQNRMVGMERLNGTGYLERVGFESGLDDGERVAVVEVVVHHSGVPLLTDLIFIAASKLLFTCVQW